MNVFNRKAVYYKTNTKTQQNKIYIKRHTKKTEDKQIIFHYKLTQQVNNDLCLKIRYLSSVKQSNYIT